MPEMGRTEGVGEEIARPFVIERTTGFTVRDRVSGDDYQVWLGLPDGGMPVAGWPVLYLLDAHSAFGTCVEAVRRMAARSSATGVVPMVVVGISSPEGYDVPRRRRDYTTPLPQSAEDETGQAGAAARFLEFLEREIKSEVGRRIPIDETRQTLCGHSLAGYFVLWALTARPSAFQAYAAISPSIWWDKPALLTGAARHVGGPQRLLVTVGEWEDALPPWQRAAADHEAVAARRAARGMVPGAREVAQAFASTLGGERVTFSVLPEEDHASIVSTAMPRILRFASQT